MKSLKQLLKFVKKKGDLDKTLAVKGEIGHFQKEKTIKDGSSEIEEIKKIQRTYIDKVSDR